MTPLKQIRCFLIKCRASFGACDIFSSYVTKILTFFVRGAVFMGKGKICSLTQNYEFRRVYSGGTPYYGRFIVLYKKKTRFDRVRFGITATKKIGKACVRNRARRLIFESFRLFYDSINGDCDIVIIAKPNITEAGFSDILKETERLLKKAELISD